MEFILKRIALKADYTIGRLYIKENGEEKLVCDTLEPPSRHLTSEMPLRKIVRLKVMGHTAIPTGRYLLIVTRSPRFGRWLPLVWDVPGFRGIRIHPGNTVRDTEGCILPGWNNKKGVVLNSHAAMTIIMKRIEENGGKGWINIIESPTPTPPPSRGGD